MKAAEPKRYFFVQHDVDEALNFTYLVQTIDRFNLLFAEFEIKDLFEEQVKTLRNTVEHRKSASAYNL